MVSGEVARDAEPMEDPEDAACKYTRPLVYAAAHGDLPKVVALLEAGADPREAEPDGRTPMLAACESSSTGGDVDRAGILRALLRAATTPLDMDASTVHGQTALKAAVQQQDAELVRLLLENGSSVNATGGSRNVTPLMYAVMQGDENVGVVRKLLESNASVNAQDREGWSALMLGAQVDAAAVVELLLEWGALPTLQAQGEYAGWTALMLAARTGGADVAKVLVGAVMALQSAPQAQKATKVPFWNLEGDVSASENNGTDDADGMGRALTLAAANGHRDVLKILMTSGFLGHAPLCAELASGRPIRGAAMKGQAGTVLELLAASVGWAVDIGVGLDTRDKMGWTALMAAAEYGHEDVVQQLLDAGADLNMADDEGYTPLMAAATQNHVEIVDILLDAEAEIDVRDADGWTALMLAADAGSAGAVNLLLEAGADIMLTNEDGDNAVTLAISKGHLSVLNELSTHERAALREIDDDRVAEACPA